MATSPFGGFANLAPYQAAVQARRLQEIEQGGGLNQLLGNITTGAQQGATLANLPEIIAQQNQLRNNAAIRDQINTAILQREFQDPDYSLNQAIRRQAALNQLNTTSGYVPNLAPELGNVPTYQPAALSVEQQAALQSTPQSIVDLTPIPGVEVSPIGIPSAIPRPAAGAPITPVVGLGGFLTGTSFNPDIPEAAKAQALEDEITKTRARYNLTPRLYVNDATGESNYFSPGSEPEGFQAYVRPTSTTSSGGRLLTLKQQGDILEEGAIYKVENAPTIDSTPQEWNDYSIRVGKAKLETPAAMKPSEKISSENLIRNVYKELPSKISYFGTTQSKGAGEIKEELDSILDSKRVARNFDKLTGQDAGYFITRMNKLGDPTSATLIAEANLIAGRAGVMEGLLAKIKGWKTGDNVPVQVVKEIYDLVSAVEAPKRQKLIDDLPPLEKRLKGLDLGLEDIGVPSNIIKEYNQQKSSRESPVSTPGINPNAPSPINTNGFTSAAKEFFRKNQ